ncbi:hypothetical protein MKK34_04790, partial [Staphylococcus epidermidis]|nr:hypothetical protein [Staphylococcus epidermidis]
MRENYSIRVFNNLAINTEKALSVKVFYCLKGKCEVTINVQKHILEKDDIAFVVMNDTYSLLSNTETMCCIIDIPIHRYLSQKDTPFSYNQLTPPAERIVEDSVVRGSLKKKKQRQQEHRQQHTATNITERQAYDASHYRETRNHNRVITYATQNT